jgi:hypothetical protein
MGGEHFDGRILHNISSEIPMSIGGPLTKIKRIQKCLQMANLLYFKQKLAEILNTGSVISKCIILFMFPFARRLMQCR